MSLITSLRESAFLDGLGFFDVPFEDNVYELGSSIGLVCGWACVCCREAGGGGADNGAEDVLTDSDGGGFGGGGGTETGDACPAARIAACIARLWPRVLEAADGGEVGGAGGAIDRVGAFMGGRGAGAGGGGGAAGGGGAEVGGGGGACGAGGGGVACGATGAESLRIPGGGGGFLPIGGGGPFIEAEDAGLGAVLSPVLRRLATEGINAEVVAELWASGRPGGSLGAAPVGGFGAAITGGFGAEPREVSGSDV